MVFLVSTHLESTRDSSDISLPINAPKLQLDSYTCSHLQEICVCGYFVVHDMGSHLTCTSGFGHSKRAHPDNEVGLWSMTIDLPGAHSTSTSEVLLHCLTDKLTMVRISDMEPYPALRGYIK